MALVTDLNCRADPKLATLTLFSLSTLLLFVLYNCLTVGFTAFCLGDPDRADGCLVVLSVCSCVDWSWLRDIDVCSARMILELVWEEERFRWHYCWVTVCKVASVKGILS